MLISTLAIYNCILKLTTTEIMLNKRALRNVNTRGKHIFYIYTYIFFTTVNFRKCTVFYEYEWKSELVLIINCREELPIILLIYILSNELFTEAPEFILFSALKFLKNYHKAIEDQLDNNVNSGLWPSVFNLATKALITANSTCGENGKEEFCRLSDSGKVRCGICDIFSSDKSKCHSIQFAIDGTNKWWQSSPLFYGSQYEFVTITIDLKQVRTVNFKNFNCNKKFLVISR